MARGHVRPKNNGYEVIIYAGVDELTGKERRLSRMAPTLKAAEKLRTRLLREIDDGSHGGPDATMAVLLAEWVKVKRTTWSPKTALETQGYVDRWIAPPPEHPRHPWALGRRRLEDITPRLLDEFNLRLQAELAPATVQRIHGVVRAALEQAVRWDWLTRNPAARCEPIEGGSPEVRPPTVSEVRRLLASIDEAAMALFVRLAVVLGRRRGELCALRWSDVNWGASAVVVARTIVDSGAGWVERPISKNRKRFPPLAVDATTLRLLVEHRDRMTAAGASADGHMFVTATTHGLEPWSPDAVSRRFSRARDKAGLPDVHLHSLRHWAGTAMLDGGIPAPSAGGRLGHGSGGRTTQDVYAHSVPASDQAAAELLASLID